MPGSIRKAQVRSRIWELLRQRALVHSPEIYGQTPRFRGASQSVERLRRTALWERARRILVLREGVLEGVRVAAVEDGKVLIVPDLTRAGRDWIAEIDPEVLGGEPARAAARSGGAGESPPPGVRFLRGQDTSRVDLMVIGAVAVSRQGGRVGKGSGEADLIYALGRARGFVGSRTPVAAIVHELQILDESAGREPTDLPLDLIVTPAECYQVDVIRMRPKGLHPCMITAQRLRTFPGLQEILEREGISVPDRPACT